MVTIRSKARSRQTLDSVASPWVNLPESVSGSNQNTPQQPSHEGDVSSSTQDPGGRLTTSLAARNDLQPAVRKCHADYLSCPDLSRFSE